MNETLLKYYNDELAYLREKGLAFAEAHPKVGSRLRLAPGAIEDPSVGRLTESFAFLVARLRHQVDHELETLSESVLNVLYPHYLLPIPSAGTVQFEPKPQFDKPFTIPRGIRISSQTTEHQVCYFTTIYDTTLWPIKVSEAHYGRESHIKTKLSKKTLKSYLKLELSSIKTGLSLAKIAPDRIRIHLKNTAHIGYALYEQLLNNVQEIILSYSGAEGKNIHLPLSVLKPVGLTDNEGLLPYPSHSFSGYRLLTEFFAFPEKFLYLDLVGLNDYLSEGMEGKVELYFFMDQLNSSFEKQIDADTFQLGCTPVVNVFKREGEPIRLDHRQSDYHVIADAHRPQNSIEVYQIHSLEVSSDKDQKINCAPYFGKKFHDKVSDSTLCWYASRRNCEEVGVYHVPGTESFVAFSDANAFPDGLIITPQLTCTNRDLPTQLPFAGAGPEFHFWDQKYELVKRIKCIGAMVSPRYRNKTKVANTDLVAHLTLNQLSFESDGETLAVLKEVLSLYHYDNVLNEDMVAKGVVSAKCERVIERHPENLKQGFCSGVAFHLMLDEKFFPEHNVFLFGAVLQEFLTKTCSVNSFVRLVLSTKQRGEVCRWKAKLGIKPSI